MKRTIGFFLVLFTAVFSAQAQRPEGTLTLNESFFDSVLDAIFQNAGPIEFSLASNDLQRVNGETQGFRSAGKNTFEGSSRRFLNQPGFISPFAASPRRRVETDRCKEVIQLQRENNSVKTAVRFREGKILAPLAFNGNYNPPLIGCVSFAGYAETAIDLEFDQQNQRVIARARVLNVSLNGTGGVGGSLIARLVQGSIDRKINPIELFRMDKVSWLLPVQNNATLRMKAVGVRHEVANGALNIHIAYEFLKT